MSMHKSGNAKLTIKQVIEIRKLRAEGWTQPALARGFKVSVNQIAKICNGTAWTNVTQGTEVLTDGEAQLRQLTTPQPSHEEINASMERLQRLLKGNEESEREMGVVPQCYQRAENYAEELTGLIKTAEERRATSGPPPQPVEVRMRLIEVHKSQGKTWDEEMEAQSRAKVNAGQLLEALKDETHQNSKASIPNDDNARTD